VKRTAPRSRTAVQSPRRVTVDEGILVLPPASLRDLPPDGVIGSFMGIAALRFTTPAGLVAMFLHDPPAQRRQAELQLGADYARRPFWWEATP